MKSYVCCKFLVGSARVLLLLLRGSFPSPPKTMAVLRNPSEAGIVAARASARMNRLFIEARAATMFEKGERCREVHHHLKHLTLPATTGFSFPPCMGP